MPFNRYITRRLYPTAEQETQLRKTAGTTRFTYNWGLERWEEWYQKYQAGEVDTKPSAFGLDAIWTQERPEWAKETSRDAQNRVLQNLGKAYKNFFEGRAQFPKKHKKGRHKDSFYIPNNKARIRTGGSLIRLPHIGLVKLAEETHIEDKIMGYHVVRNGDIWEVLIQVQLEDDPRYGLQDGPRVGIDVGIHTPAVTSDGVKCQLSPKQAQRVTQKQSQIKSLQRALERSRLVSQKQHQQQSKRYNRLLKRKQRAQRKIDDIRKDVTHKFTTSVAKNHGTVVVEDLNLRDMMKQAKYRSMRRSLNASMMGLILSQLEYKCKYLEKVPRYFASSKTCSQCGHKKVTLKLQERTYVCQHCGLAIDRDLNAAINIRDYSPRSRG